MPHPYIRKRPAREPSADMLLTRAELNALPQQFAGQTAWLIANHRRVWNEFCGGFKPGVVLAIKSTASILPSLQLYAKPEGYLRAVLLCAEAQWLKQGKADGLPPPFTRASNRLERIIL